MPHTANQRYDVLDALRGFALFGICLANISVFSGWVATPPPVRAEIFAAEGYNFFLTLLVDGRFYTIFSFLFGIGFALQLERLNRDRGDHSAAKRYLRRLFVLLLFGLLHMFVLWHGDILALYALMGFCLFLLRGLSDRAVLWTALGLLFLPVLGYLLFWRLEVDPDGGFYEAVSRALGGDGSIRYFFQGFALNQRTEEPAVFFETLAALSYFRVGYLIETWRIPKVLGIMLLGLWAGRQLLKGQLLEQAQWFKRVLIWGLVIGLPASFWLWSLGGLSVFNTHSMNGLLAVVAYSLGVFPLAFAYMAAFVMLWQRAPKWLSVLAAPGRMALTNYLSQTVLGILIFYGLGWGLGIHWAPLVFIPMAVAIMALQTWWSTAWLKRHRYGPLEWVWRCLTYGKRLPIKKSE